METSEKGIFELCFLSFAGFTRQHTQTYLHLSELWMEETRKHVAVLISAHLLQVGRQQESRRQKLFLFVHHFSLT